MSRLLLLFFLCPWLATAQQYTSYFTGNPTDVVKTPGGGVCLMGGAEEDFNAMKWFLQRAGGGDVLVLRTSGSDGYNDYLYNNMAYDVNSVETIVCHSPAASFDPYVLQKIQQAEAIWFAGGDQWKYVFYWRDTPVDSLLNRAIRERNIVIGGTSAGMAIQGKYYFSAQNGTVTSTAALSNPYHNLVTVDSTTFIQTAHLNRVITDTHFDNPDRRGRLVTFLARIFTDYGVEATAIACDEYTAVCIDTNGIARVFGGYPSYEDNAYFIRVNCELPEQSPENCTAGVPLTWNRGGQALKVYNIKGRSNGSGFFNLNDWQTVDGGTWLNWSVNNGTFLEQNGSAISCAPLSNDENLQLDKCQVYPNPSSGRLVISNLAFDADQCQFSLYNNLGQKMPAVVQVLAPNTVEMDLANFGTGIYNLSVAVNGREWFSRVVVKG